MATASREVAVAVRVKAMFVQQRAVIFALMYYHANCHSLFLLLDMEHREGSSEPRRDFEPATFPSPLHFPNHYIVLLRALNGALRRFCTLRLGTL